MTKHVVPAFLPEALYAKSQLYIGRGLRAKQASDMDEYQLWASLALELLGKAALAKVSAALVADPTHYQSLFAACGIQLSPDLKTISAKTLFERLVHITKEFDTKTQTFCQQLALRRNAELHSGEAPFLAMAPEAWEKRFWYAIQVILSALGRTLEEWLGAEEAEAPKRVLEDAKNAIAGAVAIRTETKAEQFKGENPSENKRTALLEATRSLQAWRFSKEFSSASDGFEATTCPSCSATAVLAGILWTEEVSDEVDPDDPTIEFVDKTYLSEEFYCPTCGLRLNSRQEVLAAKLPEEFYETDTREREFEPDYGND